MGGVASLLIVVSAGRESVVIGLIVAAEVYGVTQLAALGWWARSVRWATVLTAVPVGMLMTWIPLCYGTMPPTSPCLPGGGDGCQIPCPGHISADPSQRGALRGA
jgi:hypothetical protein